MFSPRFQVGFPEPAPPSPTCFSWALWGVFRRPLWWRWTQPLSSSASLGKQRRGTPPCRAKMPTLLPHTSEGRGGHGELALQHTRSATPSGRGLGTQGGRPSHEPPPPQGLGSVEVPAIRGEEELVQVSQQQLPGVPGEGCQVPGVRQRGGMTRGAQCCPVNRRGHAGMRTTLLLCACSVMSDPV